MNVIPPISQSGSGSTSNQPAAYQELRSNPVRNTSLTVEDLTPPTRSSEPSSAPVNEPRLLAMASDTLRGSIDRQLNEIAYEMSALSKRMGEIEKTIEQAKTDPAARAPEPAPAKVSADTTATTRDRDNAPSSTISGAPSYDIDAEATYDQRIETRQSDAAMAQPDLSPILIASELPAVNAPQLTSGMLGLTNRSDVIGEIENRRGGVVDDGRSGLNLKSESDVVEINAIGTPALFKGVFLRGYRNDGGWDNENPINWVPLTLAEEIANIAELTMLREEAEQNQNTYCLQATWDWVRAKYTPPIEE